MSEDAGTGLPPLTPTPSRDTPAPGEVVAVAHGAFLETVASLDLSQAPPVAESWATHLGADGLLHVPGCGHSQLVALDPHLEPA